VPEAHKGWLARTPRLRLEARKRWDDNLDWIENPLPDGDRLRGGFAQLPRVQGGQRLEQPDHHRGIERLQLAPASPIQLFPGRIACRLRLLLPQVLLPMKPDPRAIPNPNTLPGCRTCLIAPRPATTAVAAPRSVFSQAAAAAPVLSRARRRSRSAQPWGTTAYWR